MRNCANEASEFPNALDPLDLEAPAVRRLWNMGVERPSFFPSNEGVSSFLSPNGKKVGRIYLIYVPALFHQHARAV